MKEFKKLIKKHFGCTLEQLAEEVEFDFSEVMRDEYWESAGFQNVDDADVFISILEQILIKHKIENKGSKAMCVGCGMYGEDIYEEVTEILCCRVDNGIYPFSPQGCGGCISKSGDSICGNYAGHEDVDDYRCIVNCIDKECFEEIEENNKPTNRQINAIKKYCKEKGYKCYFTGMTKQEAGMIIGHFLVNSDIPDCFEYYIVPNDEE